MGPKQDVNRFRDRKQDASYKAKSGLPPDKIYLSITERNWNEFDRWFKQYVRKTYSSSGAGEILISSKEINFYEQIPSVNADLSESDINLSEEQTKILSVISNETERAAAREVMLQEELNRTKDVNAMNKLLRKAQNKYIESVPKMQMDYNLAKSAICGEFYLHFKRDTQRLMATNAEYQQAIEGGDLLVAYGLLRAAHIVPDGELEDQQLEAEEALRALRQRDRSLAEHLAHFEERLGRCEFLDSVPSEARLMNYFLESLNPTVFASLLLDIKTKRIERPETYEELKALVKQFDVEFRKLEKKKKNDYGTRGYKPEAAYVTTTSATSSEDNKAKGQSKQSQNKKNLSEVECYACHKMGHMARDCPDTRQPKEQVKSGKPKKKDRRTHFSAGADDDEGDGASFQILYDDTDGTDISFVSIGDQFVLGLDTMSTIHLVNDIRLLKNIQPCKKKIAGVNGKAPVFATAYGDFRDFGKAYYVKESPVSCLSYNKLRGLFQRSYVDKDETFYLDNGKNQYAFKRSDEGLPVLTLPHGEDFSCATTAEELGLSKAELTRVQRVKEVYYGLNCRGRKAIKVLFDSGNLLRCDLTGKDVDNWTKVEEIEGLEPHAVRAKMKFHKAKISSGAPATRCGERLSVDYFFVNKRPYLLAVDAYTDTMLVVAMKSKSAKETESAIESIHAAFEERGHKIELITCDSENNLGAVKNFASKLGIAMEAKPPGQHEELAERHIGIVGEGFRATLSKFKDDHGCNLPRQLYPYLIRNVVSSANMVPNEKCTPSSPVIKFTGRKPDLKSDLAFRFGELVLAGVPVHRATQDFKAEYGIVVGRAPRGGFRVYLLDQHKVLVRSRLVRASKTESVAAAIKAIDAEAPEHIAEEDFIPVRDDEYYERDEDEDGDDVDEDSGEDLKERIDDIPDSAGEPEEASGPRDEAGARRDAAEGLLELGDGGRRDAAEALLDLGKVELGMHMSLKAGFKAHPDETEAGLIDECKSLLVREKAFDPARVSDLSYEQRKGAIRVFSFAKKKPDKVRVRSVANEGLFEREKFNLEGVDVYAPTARVASVFTVMGIAASTGMSVCTGDVKTAFLKATLEEKKLVKFGPIESEYYCKLDKKLRDFVDKDGCLYGWLNKALYGLRESPKLWYELVFKRLTTMGFKRTDADKCVFTRGKTIIVIYVDDFLIAAPSTKERFAVMKELENAFEKDITFKEGDELLYIGMTFTMKRRIKAVEVGQTEYFEALLKEYGVTGEAASPATNNLFEEPSGGEDVNQRAYLSLVQKLMYPAKRTRPDILLATTYLATKCREPKSHHMEKAMRVLKYLNGTKDLKLVIKPPSSLDFDVYVDASHLVHADGKGHSGCVISFGGAIEAFSNKQRLVTKSSFEAELVCADSGVSSALWQRRLMLDLGYGRRVPTIMYEDNMSVIKAAAKGEGDFKRTKHIAMRFFSIKEHIDDGDVVLKYLHTKEMVADILTKPLQGALFRKLRDKLLGVI